MKRNDATVNYENATTMPDHRQLGKRVWGAALAGALSLSVLPAVTLVVSDANSSAYAQSASSEQTEGSLALGSGPAAPGGADTKSFDYTGSYSGAIEADGETVSSENETVVASDAYENALLAQNGGVLFVTGANLAKSGDVTDGDSANFYGVNAIGLAVGSSSTLSVSSSSLSADSEGSNGLFATDSATIYASDVDISTYADNSRGLDATYAGTIVASDLDISTEGDHSAALATDRGGGNVSVTSSQLNTAGSGSPLIYSTGTIEVDDVTGTATGSQIAAMEGLNAIVISDSDLASERTSKSGSDSVVNAVLIYQSTSGDADTSAGETALFEAVDSTLSSAIESGAFFYSTNTSANVVLENTDLVYDSEAANLFIVAGNDSNNWGTPGENGAYVTATGIDQVLEGDISVDTISSLDLYLLSGSAYVGSTEIVENESGASTVDEPLTVNVSSDSTWVVTADSTVSNLNVQDGATIVDEQGESVSIVVDGETVVQGSGSVTVTVTGTFGSDFETTEANEVSEASIDRTAFDEQYGMQTSFAVDDGGAGAVSASASTNEGADASATTTRRSSSEASQRGFVASVIEALAAVIGS